MGKFVLKRILTCIPTILIVIFIIYGIMEMTPGSAARAILGQDASVEAMQALEEEMGLNKPFIVKYGDYVWSLIRGDMGTSYRSNTPVMQEILSRFPTTLKLALGGMVISICIGIPLGIIAAVKQYSAFDFCGTFLAMLMASVPYFWLGLMLILLFSLKLGWLPSMGNMTWRHFILPSLAVSVGTTASLLRLTRTTMLETIRQDYVRTARSKGQTETKVVFRHALKNALLPVVTVAAIEFGNLLGGAVVIETVFSLNGVGNLLLTSINFKDTPQVIGCAVFLATMFMFIMLMVDIIYAFIDPRIKARYQRS